MKRMSRAATARTISMYQPMMLLRSRPFDDVLIQSHYRGTGFTSHRALTLDCISPRCTSQFRAIARRPSHRICQLQSRCYTYISSNLRPRFSLIGRGHDVGCSSPPGSAALPNVRCWSTTTALALGTALLILLLSRRSPPKGGAAAGLCRCSRTRSAQRIAWLVISLPPAATASANRTASRPAAGHEAIDYSTISVTVKAS